MVQDNVIVLNGLTKDRVSSFLRKRVRVLDEVNLSVRRGETYGLLGPNGAGKTTAIKLMLGLMRPDSGQITILESPPGHHEVLRAIGFAPENPYFYSHLTGREFLEFTQSLYGEKKENDLAHLLDTVGLNLEQAMKPMRHYSKGMLQRLSIAQSLINQPEILFLDEPMSGLDPIGRRDIREILQNLKEKGKTIFFNSHLLPDVNELCDRIGILNQGKLVVEESIANVSGSGDYKDLEEFFLSHVEVSLNE